MATQKLPDVSGYIIPLALVLILVLVVKGFFRDIFSGVGDVTDKFNITDTQAEKDAKAEVDKKIKQVEALKDNPFDKFFYTKFPGKPVHTLTVAAQKKLPKEIHDSIGGFYDEPLRILNAFKELQYKTAVSHLSRLFSDKYNRDLFQYLVKNLDTTEQKIVLGKIINYVNSLPKGV